MASFQNKGTGDTKNTEYHRKLTACFMKSTLSIANFFFALLGGFLSLATMSVDTHANMMTHDTNAVRITTNDLSLLADTSISIQIHLKGVAVGQTVKLTSEFPGVAAIPVGYESVQNGQVVKIKPKGYGRTLIRAEIESMPGTIATFPLVVTSTTRSLFQKVLHANIETAGDVSGIDPQMKGESFLYASHRFYAKNIIKASKYSELFWKVSGKAHIAQLTEGVNDSVRISFYEAGNFKVYLQDTKDGASSLDEMDFHVNMAPDVNGNIETGLLGRFKDTRDGETYPITMLDYRRTTELAVMQEHLRYYPVLYTKGSPVTDFSKPWVFDAVNTTFTDVTQLKSGTYGNARYNILAAFGTDDFATFNASNKRGVCPDGWVIPSAALLRKYLGLDFSSTIESAKLYAVLSAKDDKYSYNMQSGTEDASDVAGSTCRFFTYSNSAFQQVIFHGNTATFSNLTNPDKIALPVKCVKELR